MVMDGMFDDYNSWFLSQVTKKYYQVTDMCSSPEGDILVACDSQGQIGVFEIEEYLSPSYWLSSSVPSSPTSCFHFKAHYGTIHSFLSTTEFIISACESEVKLWEWEKIRSQISATRQQRVTNSQKIDCEPFITVDLRVRGLFLSSNDKDKLLSINMDGSISSVSLGGLNESKFDILIPFLSWTHPTSIIQRSDGSLIVGYSDGRVRMWTNSKITHEMFENKVKNIDISTEKYIAKWSEKKGASVAKKRCDKSNILCMSMDDSGDWLIIGTSENYMSIWNLSLMEFTNCIPVAGKPRKAVFYGTDILTIGSEEYVYHWNIVGKYKTRVSTSSPLLWDIHINQNNNEKYQVLFTCGNSNQIDVFSNFTHKGFSFVFPHQ